MATRSRRGGRMRWFPLVVGGELSPALHEAMRERSGVYAIRKIGESQALYVGESHCGKLWRTMLRHFQAPQTFKAIGRGSFAVRHPEKYEIAFRTTSTGNRKCRAPHGRPENADMRAIALETQWIERLKPIVNREEVGEDDTSFDFGANAPESSKGEERFSDFLERHNPGGHSIFNDGRVEVFDNGVEEPWSVDVDGQHYANVWTWAEVEKIRRKVRGEPEPEGVPLSKMVPTKLIDAMQKADLAVTQAELDGDDAKIRAAHLKAANAATKLATAYLKTGSPHDHYRYARRAAAHREYARIAENPRPPKGTPTALNVGALAELFDTIDVAEGDSAPNAIPPTSSASVRKAFKAGYVEPSADRKRLVLTRAGAEAIRALMAGHPMHAASHERGRAELVKELRAQGVDPSTRRAVPSPAPILPVREIEPSGQVRLFTPNPRGALIELGALTELTYVDAGGALVVLRWALASAPVLAYDEAGRLFILYPGRIVRASTNAEREAYNASHWAARAKGIVRGAIGALRPLRRLGVGREIVYTTMKGRDRELVDYRHRWGEGASGKWRAPVVAMHECGAKGCEGEGAIALVGGTYRMVADRGIVG